MPWRQLLLSGPVWAIILTHVASIYGFFTIVNQLPTFMKKVLKFNIKQVGPRCLGCALDDQQLDSNAWCSHVPCFLIRRTA